MSVTLDSNVPLDNVTKGFPWQALEDCVKFHKSVNWVSPSDDVHVSYNMSHNGSPNTVQLLLIAFNCALVPVLFESAPAIAVAHTDTLTHKQISQNLEISYSIS